MLLCGEPQMDLLNMIRVFKETTFVNCSLNTIMEKTFTVGQKNESFTKLYSLKVSSYIQYSRL